MNVHRLSVTTLLIAFVSLSSAHANEAVHIAYQESLDQLRLTQYTQSADHQKPGADQAQSLDFDAFGKRFDIRLESNNALLSAAQRSAVDKQLEIYRGEIAGIEGSWARIVVANGIPRGMLWDGADMYAIEVATNTVTGEEKAYIYRLADLRITPGALTCSHVSKASDARGLLQAVLGEVTAISAQGPGATSEIDLAVIGDFEFTSAKGANAEADLITRMNNVDGIYSMQLAVQINVNRIDTFASSNDPFSDESDAGALLDELADFRDSTPEQNANGLTHLFTGRELDGMTVGVAFGGALCLQRFGAGLTQGTHSVTLDSLIAAHEIGHNFGAPHDGTIGSPCESEPQDFLMAPSLNGSDTFSACSITEMQDDVISASCISKLPSTDVAVVSGGQPAPVLLGNTGTVTFNANSVGTQSATGVNVDVVIPPAVTLNSVSVGSGICTTGAGSASCAIGTIAAGSGVTVTITVGTPAVGNSDFVASVTADADENSNNNQSTVTLTVNPAVDLVSTAAAAAQISLNESTTIRPTIENRSSITATNVSVTVNPDAGIRIDSASWSPGTCSIANGVATCQAASLAAQSNDSLELQITASGGGNLSYQVSASANEADRDTSNNNASGQINVSGGNNSGNSGGGSGSLGWMTVLLLVFGRLTISSRYRGDR